MLNIFTDIGNWFNEVTEPVRDFFVENARNPFLWVGIIVIGLIVFEVTYKALSKDR